MILRTFEEAGTGLVVIDGKLIEKPVLRDVHRILAIAERIFGAGLDAGHGRHGRFKVRVSAHPHREGAGWADRTPDAGGCAGPPLELRVPDDGPPRFRVRETRDAKAGWRDGGDSA